MSTFWRPSFTVPLVIVSAVLLVAGLLAVPEDPLPADPEVTASIDPEACIGVAEDMARTMQRYVQQFEDVSVADLTAGAEVEDPVDLQAEGRAFQERAALVGCLPEDLADALVGEVDIVRGEGPIATAIATSLRSAVLRQASDEPLSFEPETRRVATVDDLAVAAAAVNPGSTLVLSAGEHVLDQTLVLLQPLNLVGAGIDETSIVAEASGGAVVSLSSGVLGLEGLTVEHRGAAAADLVVVGGGEFRLEDVRLTGAVRDAAGRGGTALLAAGVTFAAPLVGGDEDDVSTVREMVRVEVVDNAGEGVTLLGGPAASVAGSRFQGNGTCGLCLLGAPVELSESEFTGNGSGVAVSRGGRLVARSVTFRENAQAGIVLEGESGGDIRAATFEGNGTVGVAVNGRASPNVDGSTFVGHAVALAVIGEATPSITDNVFEDNDIAIQIAGSAAPTLEGNTIRGGGRVGLLFGDSSAGTTSGNDVSGDLVVGLQVQDEASPQLVDDRITSTGEVGLLYIDRAGGTADGLRLAGQSVAIQVRDTSSPGLTGNVVDAYRQAGIAYSGSARGSARSNVCDGGGIGILLVENARPVRSDNRCQPLDLR